MKTQSMIKTFESFSIKAQAAISTLQTKVGKDAEEQAKITIKLANLSAAMKYCKAVMVKNNHIPTDAKALVAFNAITYEKKDLESAPVLNTIDDVYTSYMAFRGLLAETDGFMYRMWIKTGSIVYATLHYVNKYTFRLVWKGMVWLWTKTKGFFTKAPVVSSETTVTTEATPVVEPITEATVEASEPTVEPIAEASELDNVCELISEINSEIVSLIAELESKEEEEADCSTAVVDPKAKWAAIAKDSNYDMEVIAKAFITSEGDNEELFSSIFGITPEYVAKIFSAIRPVKDETGATETSTPVSNVATTSKKASKKAPKKGKKS